MIESGLKTLIGGRDSNYPLISGTNGGLVLHEIEGKFGYRRVLR